ncbi:hypothetical protein IPL68_05675 [Candidatus Saccharibacteria bacterium]|nr:MAG: hypothetical protein IPL68_05675 [Candidatus Saccharibacteria bacterium]
MNWVTWSLIMFGSSVGLYLVVRKSALSGVPEAYTNLAMFALPLFVYTGLALEQQTTFDMSAWQLGLIVVAAIVFAYGGNTTSCEPSESRLTLVIVWSYQRAMFCLRRFLRYFFAGRIVGA